MSDDTAVAPRCMFFKLPLEIREMILQLVYSESREIQVVNRSDWRCKEAMRRREEGPQFTVSSDDRQTVTPADQRVAAAFSRICVLKHDREQGVLRPCRRGLCAKSDILFQKRVYDR